MTRQHGIGRPPAAAAAVLVALVAIALSGCAADMHVAVAPAAPSSDPPGSLLPSDATPAHVSLTVASHAHMMRIPRSYLGFSTEYWTLPTDELHVQAYRRMLSLVHVPGDGRLVLRIGGDSSDHTFWDPDLTRLPHWAFELTPDFVERTPASSTRCACA